jgi:hypothetical protein
MQNAKWSFNDVLSRRHVLEKIEALEYGTCLHPLPSNLTLGEFKELITLPLKSEKLVFEKDRPTIGGLELVDAS